MASISEIDDHLGTNPPCLKSNEATNDAVSNEQGMFTNFYYGHRSNQLLTSKKKFTQKLKKYNSLDELNMRAFELLTKLTNEEVLSIALYIPCQKDCCKVEMTLKIKRQTYHYYPK